MVFHAVGRENQTGGEKQEGQEHVEHGEESMGQSNGEQPQEDDDHATDQTDENGAYLCTQERESILEGIQKRVQICGDRPEGGCARRTSATDIASTENKISKKTAKYKIQWSTQYGVQYSDGR